MVLELLFKKKVILARFFGHFVPSAIGPLTDHPLISSFMHDIYRREEVCWKLGLKPLLTNIERVILENNQKYRFGVKWRTHKYKEKI